MHKDIAQVCYIADKIEITLKKLLRLSAAQFTWKQRKNLAKWKENRPDFSAWFLRSDLFLVDFRLFSTCRFLVDFGSILGQFRLLSMFWFLVVFWPILGRPPFRFWFDFFPVFFCFLLVSSLVGRDCRLTVGTNSLECYGIERHRACMPCCTSAFAPWAASGSQACPGPCGWWTRPT